MKVAEKLKYKSLSKEEIRTYLNRLLRFRYPPDTRERVYSQILTTHLIEPKISKKIFDTLKPAEIDEMVEEIWNRHALEYSSNKDLFLDEIRCFNSRRMLEDILRTNLPKIFCANTTKRALEYAGYSCFDGISYDEIYFELRKEHVLFLPEKKSMPISKVILVEGETEAILLPKFANMLGFDFEQNGVFLVASGGKNQVVKDYLRFKEILNLPILIVLDNDAKSQFADIFSILRIQDKIFLIPDGEFEDLLEKDLIKKSINKNFHEIFNINFELLNSSEPMTHKLHEIYRINGFGDFKKVEFAKMIFDNLQNKEDLGEKITKLIDFLK